MSPIWDLPSGTHCLANLVLKWRKPTLPYLNSPPLKLALDDQAVVPGRSDSGARGLLGTPQRWADVTLPTGVITEFAELGPHESQAENSKRKLEFERGRILSAGLLSQLEGSTKVGVADDRSPIWPKGFVGSISHSSKIVWAAVARQIDITSIGIDTEPVVDFKTQNQLRNEIATPEEWATVESFGHNPSIGFTLVFSAKEAFYKCIFPLSRKFFGFHDAQIKSVGGSSIRICMSASNPNLAASSAASSQRPIAIPKSLDVRFLVHRGNVFTATWISTQNNFHHQLP